MEQNFEFKKNRPFGDLISDTFNFIKSDFRRILRFLLIYSGPVILISAISGAFFQATVMKSINPSNLQMLSDPKDYLYDLFNSNIKYIMLYLLFALIASVFMISASLSYINTYIKNKEKGFELEDVWVEMRNNLGATFANTMLLILLYIFGFAIIVVIISLTATIIPIAILLGIGFMCLFIYFSLALSFLYCAQIFEQKSFGEALGRSFQLIKGYWWYTFGLFLVMGIITAIFGYVAGVPNQIVLQVFKTELYSNSVSFPSVLGMITTTFTIFVSTIITVITQINIALQYFNLIEKKETPELLSKINEL